MELKLLIEKIKQSKLPEYTKEYVISCIEIAYSLGKEDMLKEATSKMEQILNKV